ncbi:hypothetical protein DB820_09735, partial [Xanthomonas perforans]
MSGAGSRTRAWRPEPCCISSPSPIASPRRHWPHIWTPTSSACGSTSILGYSSRPAHRPMVL